MRGYTSLWLAFVTLVVVVQIINSEMYGNRLRHLTNWAWLLNGLAALTYAVAETVTPRTVPLVTYVAVLGVDVFVMIGITYITIRDDTILREVALRNGWAFTWAGNVLLHYVPFLPFAILLFLERDLLSRELSSYRITEALLRLNAPAWLFVTLYGVWFDPAREYPGSGIVFEDMFVSGVTGILFTNACVLASLPTVRGGQPE